MDLKMEGVNIVRPALLLNFHLVGLHGQLVDHEIVELVHFFPQARGQHRSPCL